jgi:hypothetical protein
MAKELQQLQEHKTFKRLFTAVSDDGKPVRKEVTLVIDFNKLYNHVGVRCSKNKDGRTLVLNGIIIGQIKEVE